MTDSNDRIIRRIRPAILELAAYPATAPRAGIRLDANESPFAPSDAFYADLAKEIHQHGLNRYPDPTGQRVREGLASRLGGSAEQYVLGNGSDECLLLLPALFCQSSVAYLDPSFAMYRVAALTHGHTPLPVPLTKTFELDEASTLRLLADEKPAVFFIASPNNPTNNVFDAAGIMRLIQAAPDTLFVIDEAYGPYNEWSAHRVFHSQANVAVLGTISKIGFAGLRLGWLRIAPALATELEKLRAPYNTSVAAQLGAALLLETYWKEAHRTVDTLIDERGRLERHLQTHGYRYTQSRSNSLLVDCGANHARVREALAQNKVHVRWFGHPALQEHFRVSIGSKDENDAFMRALPSLAG